MLDGVMVCYVHRVISNHQQWGQKVPGGFIHIFICLSLSLCSLCINVIQQIRHQLNCFMKDWDGSCRKRMMSSFVLRQKLLNQSFQAALPVAQTVKRLSTMRETWVQSLGQEDLLEKEMATHSSILAWKIPWTEEPGRLQLQRVTHN